MWEFLDSRFYNRMKKVFKKGSSSPVLQFAAVAIICLALLALFKGREGFQGGGGMPEPVLNVFKTAFPSLE